MQSLSKASSYPEDYATEEDLNGDGFYSHECSECGVGFAGHKCRTVCRRCASRDDPELKERATRFVEKWMAGRYGMIGTYGFENMADCCIDFVFELENGK